MSVTTTPPARHPVNASTRNALYFHLSHSLGVLGAVAAVYAVSVLAHGVHGGATYAALLAVVGAIMIAQLIARRRAWTYVSGAIAAADRDDHCAPSFIRPPLDTAWTLAHIATTVLVGFAVAYWLEGDPIVRATILVAAGVYGTASSTVKVVSDLIWRRDLGRGLARELALDALRLIAFLSWTIHGSSCTFPMSGPTTPPATAL